MAAGLGWQTDAAPRFTDRPSRCRAQRSACGEARRQQRLRVQKDTGRINIRTAGMCLRGREVACIVSGGECKWNGLGRQKAARSHTVNIAFFHLTFECVSPFNPVYAVSVTAHTHTNCPMRPDSRMNSGCIKKSGHPVSSVQCLRPWKRSQTLICSEGSTQTAQKQKTSSPEGSLMSWSQGLFQATQEHCSSVCFWLLVKISLCN